MKKISFVSIIIGILLLGINLKGQDLNIRTYNEYKDKMDRYYESASIKEEEQQWDRIIDRASRVVTAEWEEEAMREIDLEIDRRTSLGEDADAVRDELLTLFRDRLKPLFEDDMAADKFYEKGKWIAGIAQIVLPEFNREALISAIESGRGIPENIDFNEAYGQWNDIVGLEFRMLWGEYAASMEERRAALLALYDYVDDARLGYTDGIDERLERIMFERQREEELFFIGAGNEFIFNRMYDTDSLRRESESGSAEAITRQILDVTYSDIEDIIDQALYMSDDNFGGNPLEAVENAPVERIKAIIDAGIYSWRMAEEKLLSARIAWEKGAWGGYEAADDVWEEAFRELQAEKNRWLEKISDQEYIGEILWDNSLEDFDRNHEQALDELSRYIDSQGGIWDEYILSLKGMVEKGSEAMLNGYESIRWLRDIEATLRSEGKNGLADDTLQQIENWNEVLSGFDRILRDSEIMLHDGDIGGREVVITGMDGSVYSFTGSGLFDDARDDALYMVYRDTDANGNEYVVFESRVFNERDPYVLTAAEFELEKLKIEEEFWSKRLEMARRVYEYAYNETGRPSKGEQEEILEAARQERDRLKAEFDRARDRLMDEFLPDVENSRTGLDASQEALLGAKEAYELAEENFRAANEKLLYLENPNAMEILIKEMNELTKTLSDARRSVLDQEDEVFRLAGKYYAAMEIKSLVDNTYNYRERLLEALAVLEGDDDHQGYRENRNSLQQILATEEVEGREYAETLAAALLENENVFTAWAQEEDDHYMNGPNKDLSDAEEGLKLNYTKFTSLKDILNRLKEHSPDAEDIEGELIYELLPAKYTSTFSGVTYTDIKDAVRDSENLSESDDRLGVIVKYSGGMLGRTSLAGKSALEIGQMLFTVWKSVIFGIPMSKAGDVSELERRYIFNMLPWRISDEKFHGITYEHILNAIEKASGENGNEIYLEQIVSFSNDQLSMEDLQGQDASAITEMLFNIWLNAVPEAERQAESGIFEIAEDEFNNRLFELMISVNTSREAVENAYSTAREVVKYLLEDFDGAAEINADMEYSMDWINNRLKDASRLNLFAARRNYETLGSLNELLETYSGDFDYPDLLNRTILLSKNSFAEDIRNGGNGFAQYINIYHYLKLKNEIVGATPNEGEGDNVYNWDMFLDEIPFEVRRGEYIKNLYEQGTAGFNPDPVYVMKLAEQWNLEIDRRLDPAGGEMTPEDELYIEERMVYISALLDPDSAMIFEGPALLSDRLLEYSVMGNLCSYAQRNYDQSVEKSIKDRHGIIDRIIAGLNGFLNDGESPVTALEFNEALKGGQDYSVLERMGRHLGDYIKSPGFQDLPKSLQEALVETQNRYIEMLTIEYVSANRNGIDIEAAMEEVSRQIGVLERLILSTGYEGGSPVETNLFGRLYSIYTEDYSTERTAFMQSEPYALFTDQVYRMIDVMNDYLADLNTLPGFQNLTGNTIASLIPDAVSRLEEMRYEYEVLYYTYEYLSNSFIYINRSDTGDGIAEYREQLLDTGEGGFHAIDEFTADREAFADHVIEGLRIYHIKTKIQEAFEADEFNAGDTLLGWMTALIESLGYDIYRIPESGLDELFLFAQVNYYSLLNETADPGSEFRADETADEFKDYAYRLEFLRLCMNNFNAKTHPAFEDLFSAFLQKYSVTEPDAQGGPGIAENEYIRNQETEYKDIFDSISDLTKRYEYEKLCYLKEYLENGDPGHDIPGFLDEGVIYEESIVDGADDFIMLYGSRDSFAGEILSQYREHRIKNEVLEAMAGENFSIDAGDVAGWLEDFVTALDYEFSGLTPEEQQDYLDFAQSAYDERLLRIETGTWADGQIEDFIKGSYKLDFLDLCLGNRERNEPLVFEELFNSFLADKVPAEDALYVQDLRIEYEELYNGLHGRAEMPYIEETLGRMMANLLLEGRYYNAFLMKGIVETNEFLRSQGITEEHGDHDFMEHSLEALRQKLALVEDYIPLYDVEAYIIEKGITDSEDMNFIRRFALSPQAVSPFAFMDINNVFDVKTAADSIERDFNELAKSIFGDNENAGEIAEFRNYYDSIILLKNQLKRLRDFQDLGSGAFENFRVSYDQAFSDWDYYIGKYVESGRDDRFLVIKPGESIEDLEDSDYERLAEANGVEADILRENINDYVIMKHDAVNFDIPQHIIDIYRAGPSYADEAAGETGWLYPMANNPGAILSDRITGNSFNTVNALDGGENLIDAGVLDNSLIEAMTEFNRSLYKIMLIAGVLENTIEEASALGLGTDDLVSTADMIRHYGSLYDEETGTLGDASDLDGRIDSAFMNWNRENSESIISEARDEYYGTMAGIAGVKEKIVRNARLRRGLGLEIEDYLQGAQYTGPRDAYSERKTQYDAAKADLEQRETDYRGAQQRYFDQLNVISELYKRLKAAVDNYDVEKAVYEYAATAYLYNDSANADDSLEENKRMQDASQEYDLMQSIHEDLVRRIEETEAEVLAVDAQNVMDDQQYVRLMNELKEKAQRYFRISKAAKIIQEEVKRRDIAYKDAKEEYDSYRDELIRTSGDTGAMQQRDEFLNWFMTRTMTMNVGPVRRNMLPSPLDDISPMDAVMPSYVSENFYQYSARWYNVYILEDEKYKTAPLFFGDSTGDIDGHMMDYMSAMNGDFQGGDLYGEMKTYFDNYLDYKENFALWTRFIWESTLIPLWSSLKALEKTVNSLNSSIRNINRAISRIKYCSSCKRALRRTLGSLLDAFSAALNSLNYLDQQLMNLIYGNVHDYYKKAETHLNNAQSGINQINGMLGELRNRKKKMTDAMINLADLTQIESFDNDPDAGTIVYVDEWGNTRTKEKRSLKTVIRELALSNGFDIGDEELDYLVSSMSGDEDMYDASADRLPAEAVFDENGEPVDESGDDRQDDWPSYWNAGDVMGKFSAHMNQRRLADMEAYLDYTAEITSGDVPLFDPVVVWRAKEDLFSEMALSSLEDDFYSAAETGRAYRGYKKAMIEYFAVNEGLHFEDIELLDLMIDDEDSGLDQAFSSMLGRTSIDEDGDEYGYGVNDIELYQRKKIQQYEWEMKRRYIEYERIRWFEKFYDIVERGKKQWGNMEDSFAQQWTQWRRNTREDIAKGVTDWNDKYQALINRETEWINKSAEELSLADAEELSMSIGRLVNTMIDEMNDKYPGGAIIDEIDVSAILKDILKDAPDVIPEDLMKLAGDIDTGLAVNHLSLRSLNTGLIRQFDDLMSGYRKQIQRTSNLRLLAAMEEMIKRFEKTIADMNKSNDREIFGLVSGFSYSKSGDAYTRELSSLKQEVKGYNAYSFDGGDFLDKNISPYKAKMNIQGDFEDAVIEMDDNMPETLMNMIMKDLEINFEKEVEKVTEHAGEYSQYDDDGGKIAAGSGERARILDKLMDNEEDVARQQAVREMAIRIAATSAAITCTATGVGAIAGAAIMIGTEAYLTAEKQSRDQMTRQDWARAGVSVSLAAAGGYISGAGLFSSLGTGANIANAGLIGSMNFAASGIKYRKDGSIDYQITNRDMTVGLIGMGIAMAGAGMNLNSNYAWNIGAGMATSGLSSADGEDWWGFNSSSEAMMTGFASGLSKAYVNNRGGAGGQMSFEQRINMNIMNKVISGTMQNSIMLGYNLSGGDSIGSALLYKWNMGAMMYDIDDLAGDYAGVLAQRIHSKPVSAKTRENMDKHGLEDASENSRPADSSDPFQGAEDLTGLAWLGRKADSLLSGAWNGVTDFFDKLGTGIAGSFAGLGDGFKALYQRTANWFGDRGFNTNMEIAMGGYTAYMAAENVMNNLHKFHTGNLTDNYTFAKTGNHYTDDMNMQYKSLEEKILNDPLAQEVLTKFGVQRLSDLHGKYLTAEEYAVLNMAAMDGMSGGQKDLFAKQANISDAWQYDAARMAGNTVQYYANGKMNSSGIWSEGPVPVYRPKPSVQGDKGSYYDSLVNNMLSDPLAGSNFSGNLSRALMSVDLDAAMDPARRYIRLMGEDAFRSSLVIDHDRLMSYQFGEYDHLGTMFLREEYMQKELGKMLGLTAATMVTAELLAPVLAPYIGGAFTNIAGNLGRFGGCMMKGYNWIGGAQGLTNAALDMSFGAAQKLTGYTLSHYKNFDPLDAFAVTAIGAGAGLLGNVWGRYSNMVNSTIFNLPINNLLRYSGTGLISGASTIGSQMYLNNSARDISMAAVLWSAGTSMFGRYISTAQANAGYTNYWLSSGLAKGSLFVPTVIGKWMISQFENEWNRRYGE